LPSFGNNPYLKLRLVPLTAVHELAALISQVYEVDPPQCPASGGTMEIINIAARRRLLQTHPANILVGNKWQLRMWLGLSLAKV